jgi:hypothetical protein
MEQWRIKHTYWLSQRVGVPLRRREIIWSDELPPFELTKQVAAQRATEQENLELDDVFNSNVRLQTARQILIGSFLILKTWEDWEDLNPHKASVSQ